MAFLSSNVCPSDLAQVFAFDDDYSFGILQSSLHFTWFKTSSRMKVESDLRYSVREVFETFPWPQKPDAKNVLAVAREAQTLRAVREEMLKSLGGGLRELYQLCELPGKNALKEAQDSLDKAVVHCYGFSNDGNGAEQLLALNEIVAMRERNKSDVTSPGVPVGVDRGALESSDCLTA